ncbi:MAG: 16S rRNA (cytosine(1402)-N(4))-methyltransferase RsmH [Bacteroidia bacterium]|nr:16S rRNA (cytosine(1402)-N(4))-methyltransferase RsmH [Bacteroidia bacterium]
MSSGYHTPVLLEPALELLDVKPGGTYVDATFGGGGHSRAILSRLGEGRLLAFDRDPDAALNRPADSRLLWAAADFAQLEAELHRHGIAAVDGILADLGVSSHQFDTPERGFSFRFDAPLDMRMSPLQELTAADLVNTLEEDRLYRLLRDLGEVENARKAAGAILQARARSAIRTTAGLKLALEPCLPPKGQAKYLAQVFQALRIVVNGELDSLKTLLLSALKVTAPGARVVVIAYHSLEDRLVKHFLRTGNFEDREEKDLYGNSLSPWRLLTRKAIQPPEDEVQANPRARSARLRAAERR